MLNNRLLTLLESIRTSFWFIPSTMVCCAALLAHAFLAFDHYGDGSDLEALAFLYQTSAESARSILSTIATSMMTVTSIAFSITVVALTLASSQFGPRLIRNFMSDKGTQFTLGAFVSIYIYCILVLQATQSTDSQSFIPGASVFFAVALAFFGVAILIYFIHHVAQAIQADNVVDRVYCELQNNINRLFPDDDEPSAGKAHTLEADDFSVQKQILAPQDGYLQALDADGLCKFARQNDVKIVVLRMAGDFVIKHSPIMYVHYKSGQSNNHELPFEISECLSFITIGAKRTPIQDPEFAIHQLVEVAVRALSPGINDPYTAMTCVDKLSAILCQLTHRPFPPHLHYDDKHCVRLETKQITFDCLAESAFNQIRQYGQSSVAVTIRLIESLANIARASQDQAQRDFVDKQITMLAQTNNQLALPRYDKEAIEQGIEQVKGCLANFKQN